MTPLEKLKAHFEKPFIVNASNVFQRDERKVAKALVDAAVEYAEKRERAVLRYLQKHDECDWRCDRVKRFSAELRALLEKGEA